MSKKRKADDYNVTNLTQQTLNRVSPNKETQKVKYNLLHPCDYPKDFRFSHLGIGCSMCKTPVRLTRTSVLSHLNKIHCKTVNYEKFEEFAKAQVEEMKKLPFLYRIVKQELKYHCYCGKVFDKRKYANRHCRDSSNSKCQYDLINLQKACVQYGCFSWRDLDQTERGQLDELADIPNNYEKTWKLIEGYVRFDEDIGKWVSYMSMLLSEYNLLNSVLIRQHLKFMSLDTTNEDLLYMFERTSIWLTREARYHVPIVPGNYRAGLLLFDATAEADPDRRSNTFSFRHDAEKLVPEAQKLLVYAWNLRQVSLPKKEGYTDATIAGLLCKLFIESPLPLTQHTVVMKYNMIRSFKMDKSGNLSMCPCGTTAKRMAAILSILRTAACTSCVYATCADLHAENYVTKARQGRVNNMICPAIATFKRMQACKPKLCNATLEDNGDILVDNILVEYSKWSQTIPTLVSSIKELIPQIAEGDWYLDLLNEDMPIALSIDRTTGFIEVDGIEPRFRSGVDIALVEKLRVKVEYGYHSLGGGSMRYTEVVRSLMINIVWHNNTVHYSTVPIKQGTVFISNKKPVPRFLPPPLARAFIFVRLFMQDNGPPPKELLPKLSNEKRHKKITMNREVSNLFQLGEHIPTLLQVRKMTCSFHNATFPNTRIPDTEVSISCVDKVAELSGHTSMTHMLSYGSTMVGGVHKLIRQLHEALGYKYRSTSGMRQPNKFMISTTVKRIYGSEATFKSSEQEEMLVWSILKSETHALILLSCGGGKSALWTIFPAMNGLYGYKRQCIFVIVPFTYLAKSHQECLVSILPRTASVTTLILTGSDVTKTKVPDIFSVDNVPPDVIFCNLEGANNLVSHHLHTVHNWVKQGYIKKFIVDEVHTVLMESFRSSYDFLPRLTIFGVPIGLCSGTLPEMTIPQLKKFFNLEASNATTVSLFRQRRLIGEFPRGFNFAVRHVTDLPVATKLCVTEIYDISSNAESMHIFVSSKVAGNEILSRLTPDHQCAMVCSDTSPEEQSEIAKKWISGQLKILISTTVALVGTESSHCRHLIIAGHLFNLVCLTQAINRLRDSQRRQGGSIHVLIKEWTGGIIKSYERKDRENYKDLKAKKMLAIKYEEYDEVFTYRSVYDWAFNMSGCRIQNIYNAFRASCQPCNVCDLCKTVPVAVTMRNAAYAASVTSVIDDRTNTVINLLEQRCLVCNRSECNGDDQKSCHNRDNCKICNQPGHKQPQCPVKYTVILSHKACYHCWLHHKATGYKYHGIRECPIGYRLRQVIFRRAKKERIEDMDWYLRRIYATKDKFQEFLAKEIETPVGAEADN